MERSAKCQVVPGARPDTRIDRGRPARAAPADRATCPREARRRDRLGGIAGRRRRRGRPGHPRGTPGQGDAGLVDRRYGQVGHGGRRRVSGGGGGAAVAACATFDGGALLPASSTVFSEVVVVPAVVLTTCDCGARRRGGRLARHGLREREVRCADGAGGITQVVACGRAADPSSPGRSAERHARLGGSRRIRSSPRPARRVGRINVVQITFDSAERCRLVARLQRGWSCSVAGHRPSSTARRRHCPASVREAGVAAAKFAAVMPSWSSAGRSSWPGRRRHLPGAQVSATVRSSRSRHSASSSRRGRVVRWRRGRERGGGRSVRVDQFGTSSALLREVVIAAAASGHRQRLRRRRPPEPVRRRPPWPRRSCLTRWRGGIAQVVARGDARHAVIARAPGEASRRRPSARTPRDSPPRGGTASPGQNRDGRHVRQPSYGLVRLQGEPVRAPAARFPTASDCAAPPRPAWRVADAVASEKEAALSGVAA